MAELILTEQMAKLILAGPMTEPMVEQTEWKPLAKMRTQIALYYCLMIFLTQ
jgi:hypothetical protein